MAKVFYQDDLIFPYLTIAMAVAAGMEATIFFVIQMEGMRSMAPNDDTHPAFGAALREAAAHGVQVLAYDCTVTADSLAIRQPVPVLL